MNICSKITQKRDFLCPKNGLGRPNPGIEITPEAIDKLVNLVYYVVLMLKYTMLKNRILMAIIIGFLLVNPTAVTKAAYGTVSEVAPSQWNKVGSFKVSAQTVKVYDSLEAKKSTFILYKGMRVKSQNIIDKDGVKWLQSKFGVKNYFIPAVEADGKTNVIPVGDVSIATVKEETVAIQDEYGILDQTHRFAIKLVKEEGSKGRLETYEKTEDGYVFRNSYQVDYPKDGPKSIYGDLKTVGGPVVRYVYRTTKTSRGGKDAGQSFGGYKISYPMPHDALPYLQNGTMTVQAYNNIPAINEKNGVFTPHPHSKLGADLVIHTDVWGSLGCIILKNDEMADLFLRDLVTENDKEIIPLVIYDENVVAPAEGQLF